MRSRLRHPLRFVCRVMVLRWAWRNRYDLTRWMRFVMRLPTDVRCRDLDDIVTEARARIALSADARTRSARDLDITGLDNGTLMVHTPGQEPVTQVVREVLAPVSGITDIRIVDDRLPALEDVEASPPLADLSH